MDIDISGLANRMMNGDKSETDTKNKKKQIASTSQNSTSKNNSFQGKGSYVKNSYVGAPYNFVSFSENVYEYTEEQKTSHGIISDELFTGELTYQIEAKTPIIVDDGKDSGKPNRIGKFYKNPYGNYAIPGSTIRGLIRNNVQILGFSSMYEDIDDYALMYRRVTSKSGNGKEKSLSQKEKERYDTILGAKQIRVHGKPIGVLQNVKAGYIKKEKDNYVIYKTCLDETTTMNKKMNYYVLSERKIVEDYLASKQYHTTFSFPFFKECNENDFSRMQHKINKEFVKQVRGGRVHYIGVKDEKYQPYFAEISYELAGDKTVTAVGDVGKYTHTGYVISTGIMNEKKAIYIVPKIDINKPSILISEKDKKAFQIDFEKRKKTLEKFILPQKDEKTLEKFKDLSFFDLPEEGVLKPIFYIELAGRLYFGFTPRLRLFYDHTIKEGLLKQHKENMLDYAKSLFGYSNTNSSYKSKLSFSDAVIVNETKEKEKVQMVLAEPKPTSYSDYLKPVKGQAVTYNDNFELRGTKQYWLRTEVVPVDAKGIGAESAFCPLKEKTKFEGKIRFKNLTKEELGLLLWSVKLNENSWQNVGKAKPYGYGVISVNILSAKQMDLETAYKNEEWLELSPWKDIAVEEVISYYKETMSRIYRRNIEELPHIKEFFMMKDSKQIPEKEKIQYMNINKKEYQDRNDRVLPSIAETIKN